MATASVKVGIGERDKISAPYPRVEGARMEQRENLACKALSGSGGRKGKRVGIWRVRVVRETEYKELQQLAGHHVSYLMRK